MVNILNYSTYFSTGNSFSVTLHQLLKTEHKQLVARICKFQLYFIYLQTVKDFIS